MVVGLFCLFILVICLVIVAVCAATAPEMEDV